MNRAQEILARTAHRPWPLPRRRWSLFMRWHDLAFLHWPVPAAALAPHLPTGLKGLQIDEHDGSAWLGVVPFRMSGIRLRCAPPIPGTRAFAELNVRTYVTAGGKPGVWFFSLDAASRVAVRAARRWFHLPYFDAAIRVLRDGDAVSYESRRTHRGARPGSFVATYRPIGEPFRSAPGTLAHFLTERYCLYAAAGERLWRGEIQHAPWPLQPAKADITENTVAGALLESATTEPPLVHFARELDVVAWSLERV